MSKRTAAAASGPARHPRPASSAPAIQRTPRPRSNWNRRRPVRRLVRGRRRPLGAPFAAGAPSTAGAIGVAAITGAIASGAGMGAEATTGSAAGSVKTAITVTARPADRAGRARWLARAGAGGRALAEAAALEEADALGRPVRRERAADDPFARDRAPEAAVVGVATVVAHHEPVVGGNGDRGCEVAPAAAAALAGAVDVPVALALAVAIDVAALDVDRVARSGHHALDEVHAGLGTGGSVTRLALTARAVAARVAVRALGRMEDDHVADARIGEAVADAVDEHALADLERRHHRLARDAVRLDEEGLDAEGQPQRDRDYDDQLEERTAGRLLLRGHLGLVVSGRLGRGGGLAAIGVCLCGAGLGRRLAVGRLGLGSGGLSRSSGRLGLARGRGLGGLDLGDLVCRLGGVGGTAGVDDLLGGRALRVDGPGSRRGLGFELGDRIVHEARGDGLLGAGVAALADAGALADALTQVGELGAADVTAGGDVDLLDLGRVNGG